MRVFLSWSGPQSHRIAEELHKWMPRVIQRLDPYISSRDIEKGARWAQNLAAELDGANFGLVCLTTDNLNEPWIQFESGALSKSLEHGKVVPVLFGVDEAGLAGNPLLQFQNTKFDRVDMLKLVRTMNEQLGEHRLRAEVLEAAFEKNWPDLLTAVETHAKEVTPGKESKSKKEVLLEELAALSREQLRRIAALEDRFGAIVPSNLTSVAHIEALKLADHIADFCDALRDEINKAEGDLDAESVQVKDELKSLLGLLARVSLPLRSVSQKGGSAEAVSKAILEIRRVIGSIQSLRFH